LVPSNAYDRMGSYAFSYIGQGFTLAAGLSILLDSWVVPVWGYSVCFYVLSGCSAVALALTLVLKESW